jgi:hypothetical protein
LSRLRPLPDRAGFRGRGTPQKGTGTMHRFTRTVIAAAAIGGAALGFSVAPSSAAAQATWTVTPGGSFTGHADNPGLVMDSGTHSCTSADVTGSVKSGSGLSGTGIGQVNSMSFTGCSAFGINLTITTSGTPYSVNVTGVDAANPDRVNGEVTDVRARVSGIGCTADFTGTVHGYFSNADGTLVADGTSRDLVASNANCMGLINNGDTAALKAVLELTPASKITQD